ncbi:unnamed protein product [Cuscuta europaea]|uniref:Uncharacterized protein n=1 Tax=Cuscuta europaea TaxID=41803 RepID=A0A9P0ZE53_CUSEU|nr:unnamed protein product [Cuscuta europaea]
MSSAFSITAPPTSPTTPPPLQFSTADVGILASDFSSPVQHAVSQPQVQVAVSRPVGSIPAPPPTSESMANPFSPYAAPTPYSLFPSLPPQFPWQLSRPLLPPASPRPTPPPDSPFFGPSFAGFPGVVRPQHDNPLFGSPMAAMAQTVSHGIANVGQISTIKLKAVEDYLRRYFLITQPKILNLHLPINNITNAVLMTFKVLCNMFV